MTLRIYADFNSVGPGNVFWCLRYGPAFRPLDELGEELGLHEGMPVVLCNEDPGDRFDVSAVLTKRNTAGARWHAVADMETFRYLDQ